MATRIYLFLEEKDFQLEAWEGASSEFKRCVDNHQISVRPGCNINHANIEVRCAEIGLTFRFNLRDLNQEQSSMLKSMEQSVVEDYEDKAYDYWDQIPPFGVVELYSIELERGKRATEAEVKAFFALIYNFLLKHFMMFSFRESEIQSIRSYMIDWSSCIKTFTHNGEIGYRVKNFG
ncbi:hypothetical protein [Paenibacillus sp. CF384]|uniref:hypothetical protein n=1 Tax=Paenibacillus sp. CF384 TaxID=1884382 RepID=UPI00089B884C|nr:hypothetical protein [Paenibacillus sp. CF384]SDW21849.1 hypothetical protein SAMN05518855_1001694 [Paenibacillus sp. CF384]